MATEEAREPAAALGHANLAEVRALASSPAVSVVSTDVFDTLVWRRVAEPVDVFSVLGERLAARESLAPSLSPSAFGQVRENAERIVRGSFLASHGQTEIRLSEIYDAIPDEVFAGGSRRDAQEGEIDLEREIVVPDLDVLDLLRLAHEHGKALVAVSDTYLSADQLRSLFAQPALSDLPFRHVFTSSDQRENKSGRLWDIALAAIDEPPERILHIGDNEEADVVHPARRGVRTFYLRRRSDELQALLSGEEVFRNGGGDGAAARSVQPRPSGADFGLTTLRAKLEHRKELARMPSALAAFWRFGATVYGPALTGFAEWVHERTREAGASRALGMMREGGFLAEMVNAAAPAVAEPVSAEPLWINRDICARAAIGSCTVKELEALVVRRTPPTLAQLCGQLRIGVNELPALAGHADTSLTDPVVRTLALEAIVETPAVREKVIDMARVLRERLVRLIDSIAPGPEPLVVVDLGWGASIQRRLLRALEQAGSSRRVIGLYLLTHEGASEAVLDGGEVHGFLANCGTPHHVSKLVMRSPEILEQALMPAHGTQVDIDDALEPILAESGPPSLQHVEAQSLRRGVLACQREYLRYALELPGKLTPLSLASEAVAPLIIRSIVAPTSDEARLFGRWTHDENQGSDRAESILGVDWEEKVRHLSPAQLQQIPMDDLYWPYGLARAADPALGDLAAAASAGVIGWDATSSDLETGPMTIEIVAGIGAEHSTRYHEVPTRNRHGLSLARVSLNAGGIERLRIQLSERPSITRIDWIALKLWLQGERDPVKVRLDGPESFALLEPRDMFVVSPNLFVSTAWRPQLELDIRRLAEPVASRVDVEVAFASLASSELVPGPGSARAMLSAERDLRALRASASWRLTAPLRRLKGAR